MEKPKEEFFLKRKTYFEDTKLSKLIKSKNSGITLIALVITIIVLLILAGVSLSMILSQNRNI